MKIRAGFVSNSSSSSFVCHQCGETFSGWDASVRDFDHYECERGHVFCTPIKGIKIPKVDYNGNEVDGEFDEDDDFQRSEMPWQACPLCNMQVISDDMVWQYIIKTRDINLDNIREEMQKQFKTYQELYKFLKS